MDLLVLLLRLWESYSRRILPQIGRWRTAEHPDEWHRSSMAQQLSAAVESATAPFQYALSTRVGCECIAHALQGLTDLDPNTTIISIDGTSAFDQTSRAAMLDGLMNVEGHCSGYQPSDHISNHNTLTPPSGLLRAVILPKAPLPGPNPVPMCETDDDLWSCPTAVGDVPQSCLKVLLQCLVSPTSRSSRRCVGPK